MSRGSEIQGSSSHLIRDAEVRDLPAIVAIYNGFVAGGIATADTAPVRVEGRAEWFRSHEAGRNPLWVWEEDGQIAGWISFSSYRMGRPALASVRELSFFVSASHQGRGIARSLLKQALDRAPDLGIENFICFVMAHNVPSIRLLESFGFERWGLLPAVADFGGTRRDHAIYGRKV